MAGGSDTVLISSQFSSKNIIGHLLHFENILRELLIDCDHEDNWQVIYVKELVMLNIWCHFGGTRELLPSIPIPASLVVTDTYNRPYFKNTVPMTLSNFAFIAIG